MPRSLRLCPLIPPSRSTPAAPHPPQNAVSAPAALPGRTQLLALSQFRTRDTVELFYPLPQDSVSVHTRARPGLPIIGGHAVGQDLHIIVK